MGTPQLDYLFLSKQCLALATPHQHHNQPCSFSFIQDCCHQKEENRGKAKPGPISPTALWGYPSPMPRAGGGCLHKKPQRCPSGVAQPCQARSILPLNMKLPLSPNPLPRGWVSPHFPSLTLMKQHGGLQGSTCFYLCLSSLCPLLPPLSFPSFSSGYFSRAGMLVLLLLPSSCDLNIKHLRKISPRAPSPGSIPGPRLHPRSPPASMTCGEGMASGLEGPMPMGPPLHTHTPQAFSCPFPSQFLSLFSICACLRRDIFNPSQLSPGEAEKGCSSPLGIL